MALEKTPVALWTPPELFLRPGIILARTIMSRVSSIDPACQLARNRKTNPLNERPHAYQFAFAYPLANLLLH
jgi:hypothetical protein